MLDQICTLSENVSSVFLAKLDYFVFCCCDVLKLGILKGVGMWFRVL